MRFQARVFCGALMSVGLLAAAGCIDAGGFLNPNFAAALGLTESSVSLPGEAPSILVGVENRTNRTVEMVVSYRDANDEAKSFTQVLEPGRKAQQALICPITEVTLGDISNLDQIGARVRLGAGLETDPYIEVEPFGVLLKAGANYDCGDEVQFAVQGGGTPSGYQTIAFITRSGKTTTVESTGTASGR